MLYCFKNQNSMKYLLKISRIILGLVFIFSGFVKGVDPLGTAYKINDYFEAYKMIWAQPLSLTLSILLCTFEFTLGVMLLLRIRMKLTSWLVLLMMSFFTVVTFYDAIANPVPDCGCFGDAIKLTNWQTFWKNVVLMAFVIPLFVYRKKYEPWMSQIKEYILIAAFAGLFGYFSVYNYNNLPVIDFLQWKVGNKMLSDNPMPSKFYLTYKNKQTNETKEYLSNELPWQDSVWMANWEYVSTREDNPNKSNLGSFSIIDSIGNDMTEHFIRNKDFQFIIAAYDLKKTNKEAFKNKILPLAEKVLAKNYSFIILTSNDRNDINNFVKELKINENIEFYSSDDTSLKAMIRSNPGLVLLKNAVVLGKWHYRNIPDFEKIDFNKLEKKYLKTSL